MISTYTPLLTTGSGHAEATPNNADAARDDNAPTFQSRLDQQHDLYRAQRAPAKPSRAPATSDTDDTEKADAPDADASTSVASRTSDRADSVRRDDADNDRQADKAEDGDKESLKNDTMGSVAPTLPFTSATLALASGLAPIPTPAAPIPTPAAPIPTPAAPAPTPAVSDHKASIIQAASTPVLTAAASVAANVSALAPTVTPAGTNAVSTPLNASASVSLNIPLNTPGVSMDSNAAAKIAASGVANASAPTPAQATAAPLALPLPNAADAATLAAANSANPDATLPTAQMPALPALSAPSSATATNSGAQLTAPSVATAAQTAMAAVQTATTPPQATNTVQAAAAPSASLAESMQADASPAMPLAPGDNRVAQRSSKTAAAVLALPLPGDSGVVTVTSLATPSTVSSTIPSGATPATDSAGGTNLSTAASKEQNLGGIERMLTLGAGKTSENSPSATAAPNGETAGTAPASASALSVGEGRATAAQRGGYAAHIPGANLGANAAAPATAASLPNASPANADPTSAINPQTDPLGVTGTTSAIAAPLNSTVRVAEALQSGGKNSLAGPTPLLAAEPTATGANTTASLLAVSDTSSRSTGQDAANGQAQSDTPARSQENTGGDAPTANLNGVVSAPTANTQATTVSGTTGTSGANGSSQLDRAQVVAQVTQHLEGMRLANGNGEMRLRLTPGHLGNVQISVSSHQDGVVARIAVETAQIQQVMDGAKAHLRATLEARGLHVQSVEVTVTPQYNGSGQSAFGQPRGSESMGERMAERAAYGRALPASAPAAADSAVSMARAVPLTRTAASRLDCQA